MKPKISVVVPVYNSEKTIKKCIESILHQIGDFELELIVVNDGSIDKSDEIIRSIIDNRILYINKPNGGVSSARNVGLIHATGLYITFIDSDDFYLNDFYLNGMVNLLENDPNLDLVIQGFTMLTRTGEREITAENKCLDIIELSKNYCVYRSMEILNAPWNKMFRSKLIKNKFNEKMTFGEDAVFVNNYLLNCKKIALNNNCGYGYICMNDSSTQLYRAKNLYDINQIQQYYSSILNLLNQNCDLTKSVEMYSLLKAEGFRTIAQRIFKAKGPFYYFKSKFLSDLNDTFLEENKELISNGTNKIIKLFVHKKYFRMKIKLIGGGKLC